MKTRHLVIACTMGLFGAGSALAGYGEGTMGADLIALQQQASVPSAAATVVYGPGEGASESIYDALAAVQQETVRAPAAGVAGPAGFVLDGVGGQDHPNEAIYDQIVREYH